MWYLSCSSWGGKRKRNKRGVFRFEERHLSLLFLFSRQRLFFHNSLRSSSRLRFTAMATSGNKNINAKLVRLSSSFPFFKFDFFLPSRFLCQIAIWVSFIFLFRNWVSIIVLLLFSNSIWSVCSVRFDLGISSDLGLVFVRKELEFFWVWSYQNSVATDTVVFSAVCLVGCISCLHSLCLIIEGRIAFHVIIRLWFQLTLFNLCNKSSVASVSSP